LLAISERIGRVLRQQQVKLAYKPQITINSLFPRPKEQKEADRPKLGLVYKSSCTNCVVCYGQTERQLKTLIAEHKKAVSLFDYNSKVACHVYENSHYMDFSYVKVVGHEANFKERLFLEAWLSTKDLNAGNGHIAIPEVYKSLARA